MENLQNMDVDELADAAVIASKNIRLYQQRSSSDTSSLASLLARVQGFPHGKPPLSEVSAHTILLLGVGAGFASPRESLTGVSAVGGAITSVGEAVFTTVVYDSREIARAKLKKLKATQFSPEGREARIARALEILCLPGPAFHADKQTWIWAAEDADIEDI